jgi:hypothetical protein
MKHQEIFNQLAILIQYWHPTKGLHCSFSNSSAETTAEDIFEKLVTHKDFVKNFAGLVGDGGAEVVKLIKLLKEKYKQMWSIHDIPHCSALVVNFALELIPSKITQFIGDIYTFFSMSPYRCSKFAALQEEFGVRPYRINKPSAA